MSQEQRDDYNKRRRMARLAKKEDNRTTKDGQGLSKRRRRPMNKKQRDDFNQHRRVARLMKKANVEAAHEIDAIAFREPQAILSEETLKEEHLGSRV